MKNMNEKSLIEYVLHPINTLQKVFNYRRDPEIRRVVPARKDLAERRSRSWMSQYFESLYSFNRLVLYAAYTEMDRDPIIIRIMDTYAKTATQPNMELGSNQGRIVWCESKNKEIIEVLTKFFDVIQLDIIAFPIMRSLFQHGDHFENIPAVRGVGIVQFDPYDPWEVARVLDAQKRLIGFTQANEVGDPGNMGKVVPYYQFLHFHTPYRRRTAQYGAESALLFGAREHWQDVQWIEDKLLIDRMRRGDRLLITYDVGGMSGEDAFEAIEELKNRLYRDQYFDGANNDLSNVPQAWGQHRDVILPVSGDNRTSIQNAPAGNTQGSLEDLNFFLRRFFGALAFPPNYLGLDISGNFDSREPLAKQDAAFANMAMGPQSCFLQEMVRACMIHLSFLNINPHESKNQFSLMMSPVSVFSEIERKDLMSMRYDLMDRALQMGRDHQWNMAFWARYVMLEYARMPEDFVDKLLQKEIESAVNEVTGAAPVITSTVKTSGEYKDLVETLKENPKALNALLFFKNGAGMQNSNSSQIGRVPKEGEELNVLEFKKMELQNENFKGILEKEKNWRKEMKGELFETFAK